MVLFVFLTAGKSAGQEVTGRSREVNAAWSALWQNRASEARTAFRAVIDADDRNLDARRGLILAELQLGYDRAVIDHLEKLSKTPGTGMKDLLLVQYCYTNIITHGKDEKTMVKICRKLAEQESFEPLDRRPVLSSLIGFALNAGDRGAVEDAADKLNRVDEWAILGPFSNVSGGGHNKDFLEYPEKSFDRVYQGRAGLNLQWFQPRRLSLSSSLNFGNHFGEGEYVTCYAGFELTVDDPSDLIVSISQAGALKVFVNHAEALDIDRVRNQQEINHLAVRFSPGTHTLIFKCSSRADYANIAVSVSDPDGGRPDDIKVRPLSSFGPQPPPAATAEIVKLPGVENLRKDYERNPRDPESAFWYLLALFQFQERESARALAGELAESFADNAAILHVSAVSALAGEDRDGWRSRMKKLSDLMPANRFGTMYEVQRLNEQHAYTRSDSVLAAAIERNPEFVTGEITMMLALHARDRTSRAVELAEKIRDKYPDYPTPYLVLAQHAEATGARDRARRLRNDAFERTTRSNESIERWSAAADREDYGEMADRLEEMLKLQPDSYIFLIYLASAKLYSGDVGKGLELTRELADDFPRVAAAQLFKADIDDLRWSDQSEKGRVIASYRRALELDPGDFDTRDKLRELTGKRPVREILPPVDLVRLRELEIDPDDYPDAGAVVLLDESRRICFKDGSNYSDYALSVRILNDEGAASFTSVETGINPFYADNDIKAMRTVKPDGQEIEAEMLFGRVAFKSLAPGDIVELYYGSSMWSAGDLNRDFWDSHTFKWNVPCLKSRYVLLVEGGTEFDWRMNNWDGNPDSLMSEMRFGEFKQYTWEMAGIEAVHDEPLLPPWRDGVPWLDVSSIQSWKEIDEWYDRLSSVPSRPDPVVADKVQEIVAGQSGADARVRSLYNFVCNEVKYEDLYFQYSAYVPEEARNVLQAMYGDCKDKACLLRSMLSEIGVESQFVLVSPLSDGKKRYLPSPRFNHVVVAIPNANGYWFLDPTAEWMPPDDIPWELKGAEGIVVGSGNAEMVTLRSGGGGLGGAGSPGTTGAMPEDTHTGCVETGISIVGEEDIHITRRECIHDGDRIADIRATLVDKSPDEQSKLINKVLNLQVTGASIEECNWQGLDAGSDSVVFDYSFLVKGGVTRQGNLKVLKLPWDSSLDRFFGVLVADAEREEPLYTYDMRVDETEYVRLEIPEGWRLLSSPEPRELINEYGGYRFSYQNRGTNLVASRRLAINRATVPVDEYPKFKQLVDGAIREQQAVVILQQH